MSRLDLNKDLPKERVHSLRLSILEQKIIGTGCSILGISKSDFIREAILLTGAFSSSNIKLGDLIKTELHRYIPEFVLDMPLAEIMNPLSELSKKVRDSFIPGYVPKKYSKKITQNQEKE